MRNREEKTRKTSWLAVAGSLVALAGLVMPWVIDTTFGGQDEMTGLQLLTSSEHLRKLGLEFLMIASVVSAMFSMLFSVTMRSRTGGLFLFAAGAMTAGVTYLVGMQITNFHPAMGSTIAQISLGDGAGVTLVGGVTIVLGGLWKLLSG